MKFYRLKGQEMDTLPYTNFENPHNDRTPGKSYPHEGVLELVSMKYAMLAGLHKSDLNDEELLRRGKRLFDEE